MIKRITSKNTTNKESDENNKNHKKIKFKKYIILFFSLIFAYIVSLIITCLIPRSEVISNIENSRISILQLGINKPLLFDSNAYILDTFSDGIMINMFIGLI
jgi:uncharacterized protein YqhQ